jgi:dCTP diphosphatase
MSNSINLDDMRLRLESFARERDWMQFHTPKNLACALSVESAELLEIFQWKENNELSALERERVGEELSDILVYLLRMSHVCEIDLIRAMDKKLEQNAKKYPAELVRGSSKKYDQY